MHITKPARFRYRHIFTTISCIYFLVLISIVMAQETECEYALEEAVEMFDVMNYSGVIDKFIDCPVRNYNGSQKKRADYILAEATSYVFMHENDFDRVVNILSKYPVSGLEVDTAQKIVLYEALGESFIEIQGDDSEDAMATISELARYSLDHDYTPDEAKLSPAFVAGFKKEQLALSNKKQKKGKGIRWLLMGGGAVAAGVAAAFLLTSGSSEQLPLPPGHPAGN